MQSKACLVIGASKENQNWDFIKGYINYRDRESHYVYCADGGVENAYALGITPNMIIGDYDSISIEPLDIPNKGLKPGMITLPREKDETDLFACVLDGLEKGFEDFILMCCTGGRLDHFMGALAILEYLNLKKAKGLIIDNKNVIMFLKNGSLTLDKDEKFKYLSIIPLDETICGVSTKGLAYTLDRETLYREKGLGISNEIIGESGRVSIEKGSALIIRSLD
ncbi:MAG: thiamine diphosphokinase [Eubacteriales bacterium]